jgi:hypothetical protein
VLVSIGFSPASTVNFSGGEPKLNQARLVELHKKVRIGQAGNTERFAFHRQHILKVGLAVDP